MSTPTERRDSRVRIVAGRRTRQSILVLHIIFGVGWMGIDLALLALLVSGETTSDGLVAASSYTAIRTIVPPTVSVLSVGMLVTGILLGLTTKWGLVRHTWVLVKLIIGIVLTILVYVALVPGVQDIPTGLEGSADAIRGTLETVRANLPFPPIVSFLALTFALVLSVFKPWGKTRWGAPSS